MAVMRGAVTTRAMANRQDDEGQRKIMNWVANSRCFNCGTSADVANAGMQHRDYLR